MNIEEFGEEAVVRTTSCGIASFASKVFDVGSACIQWARSTQRLP